MANYWPAVWSDLRGAITTTWPEASTTTFRMVDMEKINWEEMILASPPQLAAPWVVIQIHNEKTDDWGMQNEQYVSRVTFFYIASEGDGSDVAATLETKLKAMEDYLLSHSFIGADYASGMIQVLDVAETDASEVDEVTAKMLLTNFPYTAGALSFDIMFGEIVTM